MHRQFAQLKKAGLIQQRIMEVNGAHLDLNGQWMLSFVSAAFLGLHHHPDVLHAAAERLEQGLSLGFTPSLGVHDDGQQLERALAALVGQNGALIFPSTTHVAIDVLTLMTQSGDLVLVDQAAYPTSIKGVQIAEKKGVKAAAFAHNNPRALKQVLAKLTDYRPKIIVCDGVYAPEGQRTPLTELMEIAETYDCLLFVDDSNGIGILGAHPRETMPYGFGGAGTAAFCGLKTGNRLILAGSLAKAFGIPLAFVAAGPDLIAQLQEAAFSHSHCSPPSLPHTAAALTALRIHKTTGDALRWSLLEKVQHFRSGLQRHGVELATPHPYPIQSLVFASPERATRFAHQLRRKGIWAVVQLYPRDYPQEAVVRFLITVLHSEEDIEATILAVAELLT